jgi:hypothetical protein
MQSTRGSASVYAPKANFFGTRVPKALAVRRSACGPRQAVVVRNDSVLIVNTKGGGHAFLGLHLAKKLMAGGHSVTIMNDGDAEKLSKKAPFSQYASLGANIVWGNPADPATYPAGTFDVVYDNNGKDMDNCKPVIDHFKVGRWRNSNGV